MLSVSNATNLIYNLLTILNYFKRKPKTVLRVHEASAGEEGGKISLPPPRRRYSMRRNNFFLALQMGQLSGASPATV
jgi:hypothetical protein